MAAGAIAVAVAFTTDLLLGGRPGFGPLQLALAALGLMLFALGWLVPTRQQLLLITVSHLVGLCLAEIVLRGIAGGDYASIYRAHPRYLHELRPDSRKLARRQPVNGGEVIEVRINSRGFRGEELAPASNGLRVAVYGDSFIEAEFSSYPNTFVEQLETRLADRLGTSIEAVNAGVVGYGPDQISLRLADELPWLAPDLLIVALYAGNDYGDLLRNRLFALEEDGRLRETPSKISPDLRRELLLANRAPYLFKLMARAWRAYQAEEPEWIRRPEAQEPQTALLLGWLEQKRLEYREAVVDGSTVVTNLFHDYYDADISLAPQSASSEYKIQLMERVVARIKETARSSGVPLVLLIIPSAIDVCDGYDAGRVDLDRFPKYRRSQATDELESMAQDHQIPYINLFPAFRSRDANDLYFHGGDDHWNDAGQSLASSLVANFLTSGELLGLWMRRQLGGAELDP